MNAYGDALKKMPFTISHAGFLTPFRRILSPQLLCGLMIGSIAPDCLYFIREFELASFAHTSAGALSVAVPIGLLLYLILKYCFRPLVGVLPEPHASFLLSWGVDQTALKSKFFIIAAAIFVGSLSHNFVDSFTHESGAAVAIFPILRTAGFSIHGEFLPAFRILQYTGSIIGMVLLISAYSFALCKYCHATGVSLWQDLHTWSSLVSITLLTAVIATILNGGHIPTNLDLDQFRFFGFKLLITWMPLLGAAVLTLALSRALMKGTTKSK